MEPKHKVHNLIILDESGSMASIKPSIINGFNELVESIKGIQKQFPEQEHCISMVSFNGFGTKVLHFMDDVSKLNKINSENYKPASMTPLYDAMGFSFSKMQKVLESKNDYNVLVTILTDGEENASKEYSGIAIKKMIEELSEGNWTFTYIGTDHDVEKFASNMSIKNSMVFDKNSDGIKAMFKNDYNSRVRYSRNISEKKEFKENYFKRHERVFDEEEKSEPIPNPNPKRLSFWDILTGKNKFK
jgi:uncharacterized protein YegL